MATMIRINLLPVRGVKKRAAGKQVILLAYPGEAHNLTNRDNQKDFSVRMKQFFDHYLMEKPMPQWMADGLPQVRKGGPVR